MLKKCDGNGRYPLIVNVVTFSGHGFTHDGDSIAVIPEYENEIARKDGRKVARFINFSEWARKFAKIKNTLSIFILSMCRIEFSKDELENYL